jgi:hypothetical protein
VRYLNRIKFGFGSPYENHLRNLRIETLIEILICRVPNFLAEGFEGHVIVIAENILFRHSNGGASTARLSYVPRHN